MKNAIILHGKPSKEKFENPDLLDPSDSNWIPWVKHQLTIRGYKAVAPDLPRPYAPEYDAWKKEFERHDVGPDTSLIGHSAGAGFLLKWLSNNPNAPTSARLILVAPWIDPNRKYGYEFICHWRGDLLSKIGQITVFHSSNDDDQARRSLDTIRDHIMPDNAVYRDIPAYGHFLTENTMIGPEFPEILEEFA